MKRFFIIIFKIVVFLFYMQHYGQAGNQEISDFEKLREQVKEQSSDSLKLLFLQTKLKSFKKHQDTVKIADAYHLFFFQDIANREQYADSIISLTKDKKYKRHPAIGYSLKGSALYESGSYKKALDYYLTALNSAKENKNEPMYRSIQFNIGLLKNVLGEREESQVIFLDYLNFLDQTQKIKNSYSYNRALYALADSYLYDGKYDLAKKYTNKGIKGSLQEGDSALYACLIVNSGLISYNSQKYTQTIDSLSKAKKLLQKIPEERTWVAICDYYIGVSYNDLGDREKSIIHFKNVDSILQKTEDVYPVLLDAYNHLIDYYKSKKDIHKQLEYINTLLRLDSIKDDNQIYLTKNIIKKYDTVELISAKENLITQLEKDKFLKDNTILKLVLFAIVLSFGAIYGFRRSYLHKKRFLELMNASSKKASASQKQEPLKTKGGHISQEITNDLLTKLQKFEDQEMFLNSGINAKDLAKRFESNSSYLSSVVNTYKQKSISRYINDLRIDYVVKKLQSDRKLRNYTIKAIAKEVGFNSADVFAKAFHKRTGIYPSYFLKKLEQNKEETNA